jgi:hypothetical protein
MNFRTEEEAPRTQSCGRDSERDLQEVGVSRTRHDFLECAQGYTTESRRLASMVNIFHDDHVNRIPRWGFTDVPLQLG